MGDSPKAHPCEDETSEIVCNPEDEQRVTNDTLRQWGLKKLSVS